MSTKFNFSFTKDDKLDTKQLNFNLLRYSIAYYSIKELEKTERLQKVQELEKNKKSSSIQNKDDSDADDIDDIVDMTDGLSLISSDVVVVDNLVKPTKIVISRQRKTFHMARIYPKFTNTIPVTEELKKHVDESKKILAYIFKKDYIDNKRIGTFRYQRYNKGNMYVYVSSYKIGDDDLTL